MRGGGIEDELSWFNPDPYKRKSMKTKVGIATGIVIFLLCVLLWDAIFTTPPKPKPTDIIMTRDSCGWCGVVRAYSLNVNCYHYGDSVE